MSHTWLSHTPSGPCGISTSSLNSHPLCVRRPGVGWGCAGSGAGRTSSGSWSASARTSASVRQLRHHFGPFLARFSAPPHPTRAVGYALLGAHADRVPIGAWNPTVVTNLGGFRHTVGARPRRVRAGVLRHLQGVPRRGGAAEMLRRRALRRLVLRQDSGAAAREAGASKGRAAGGVRAAQQHRHTLISGLVLRCRGTDWVVCRGVGALLAW